ncbi:dTDP-4-dehydrorhamnose reductase [Flavobacteriaceae bacterium F89]|uniref:dTDP-4-dehydrorhamnose reductase n=1 Tax=Cerina litoralis TaxID=2874477 RepID=A0AAE3ERP3_9FLAO|nr:dTDP-4-dehydrorhamnose reductase [Cerina litoralis]MCG2459130.1 dTDP-4-dehydrorhamnose reductase [Cerina litoralis]
MRRILVTGSKGQLGMSLKGLAHKYPSLVCVFRDSKTLDITDVKAVNNIFDSNNFDYCINCAAYTNVEQAEKERDKAFAVNAEGVRNITYACKKNQVVLLQISTDYVFDGEKETGYLPSDNPNPINVYGESKLKGEEIIQTGLTNYFIVRTSWLYNRNYGHNFYRTILSKAKAGEDLKVTADQRGCPTNTDNLARFLLNLIVKNNKIYGIHHFSDGMAMTWYEFAKSILEENGLKDRVKLEKAKNYRTFAARPKNSVLIS